MRRRVKIAALAVVVLGAGTIATWAWRSAGARAVSSATPPDVLPAFVDAPPGPRAPDVVLFGVRPGFTTLADVEALVRDRKLACKDTSARALMREARARRTDAAPDVRADGVDATSAASSKAGWSARETNPQVRLSCEGTASDVIGDRARPAAVGRLLFVFDSPAHPLRHVSFRRLHRDGAAAGVDVASARDAAVAALGAPAEESGALPEGGGFAPYVPWTAAWRWADLTVTVRALSYGDRGVDVYEAAEVPWPVRSDAPALARAAFARGAKQ